MPAATWTSCRKDPWGNDYLYLNPGNNCDDRHLHARSRRPAERRRSGLPISTTARSEIAVTFRRIDRLYADRAAGSRRLHRRYHDYRDHRDRDTVGRWLGDDRELEREGAPFRGAVCHLQSTRRPCRAVSTASNDAGHGLSLSSNTTVELGYWVELPGDEILRCADCPEGVEFDLFLEDKRVLLDADASELDAPDEDAFGSRRLPITRMRHTCCCVLVG